MRFDGQNYLKYLKRLIARKASLTISTINGDVPKGPKPDRSASGFYRLDDASVRFATNARRSSGVKGFST